MTRLDQWKEPKRLLTCCTTTGKAAAAEPTLPPSDDAGKSISTLECSELDILEAARELIFEMRDGKPYFHVVMYELSADQRIQIAQTLDILPPDEDSPEEVSDHVRGILGIAAGIELPVYPNDHSDVEPLIEYHRQMLIRGFSAPARNGDRVCLRPTSAIGPNLDCQSVIEQLAADRTYSPADAAVIIQAVRTELARLEPASRLLDGLAAAIRALSSLLSQDDTQESTLQTCLTDHPLLPGADYREIVPKHRLGAEYEMDYALIRPSGLVDLLEIEAIPDRVFTARGNPSGALVHAEQQVADWLEWIESHGEYALSTTVRCLSADSQPQPGTATESVYDLRVR